MKQLLLIVIGLNLFFRLNAQDVCQTKIESSLIESINQKRNQTGKNRLIASLKLTQVAKEYSKRYSQKNYALPVTKDYGYTGVSKSVSFGLNTSFITADKIMLILSDYQTVFNDDWQAVGVSVENNFISVWLGKIPDEITDIKPCNEAEVFEYASFTATANEDFIIRVKEIDAQGKEKVWNPVSGNKGEELKVELSHYNPKNKPVKFIVSVSVVKYTIIPTEIPEWTISADSKEQKKVSVEFKGNSLAELKQYIQKNGIAKIKDYGALFCAVSRDSLEIVKYLIEEQNLDVNSKNFINGTPLYYCKSAQMFFYLVEKGGNVLYVEPGHKQTLLHESMDLGIPVIKFLLEKGIDINALNIDNDPPISYAISARNPELLRFMLKKGARQDLFNNYGNVSIHEACQSKNLEAVKILLENGADINIPTKTGKTPLQLALFNKDDAMVAFLKDKGAK